jgi:hypothetical protein
MYFSGLHGISPSDTMIPYVALFMQGYIVDELPIELPKDLDKYLEGPIAEKDIDRLRQSVNHQSPYGNEL